MPKTKKKPAPHKKATKPAKKVKAKAKVTAKPKAKAKPKAAPKAKAKPASKAKTKPTTAKPTQTASFKYSLFERLKAWAELFLKRPDLDVKVPLKISTESNNESSAPKLPDDAEAFAKQAAGAAPKKIIVVPGRLVNVVV